MTISFTDARPFDDSQWENENQYTPSGRNFVHSGIVRTRDGFSALNGLETTPGSSGMQVDTGTGVAHLMGFRCELDTPGSNTLSNGDITNPRIDLIISKVDLSLNTRTIEVKEGTPAATPSAPTVVRNASIYELPLMEILVPANETDINNCTFTPRYSYTDNIDVHYVNLFKNVPSKELADGVQPRWFIVEDANVDLTEEDATGESIITSSERVLKVVNGASGADKYVGQRFVFADEPTLFAEKTRVSATVLVHPVDAGNITFTLYDVGGAGVLASVTKEAIAGGGEFRMTIEDVKVGTTSVDWRISHDADSVTYYFCEPVFNVGRMAISWKPRPWEDVFKFVADVWNVDPSATTWAPADFGPDTSPLTAAVGLAVGIQGATGPVRGHLRPNGSSAGQTNATRVVAGSTGFAHAASALVLTDEDQIIERSVNDADANAWNGSLVYYKKWAS